MIKYRTRRDCITAIEIIKETEKQVTYFDRREIREAKRSDYQNWHDSFEEAKQFLIDERNSIITRLEVRLDYEKSQLARILLLSDKFNQQGE